MDSAMALDQPETTMKNYQYEIKVANEPPFWEFFSPAFTLQKVREIIAKRLGRKDFTITRII